MADISTTLIERELHYARQWLIEVQDRIKHIETIATIHRENANDVNGILIDEQDITHALIYAIRRFNIWTYGELINAINSDEYIRGVSDGGIAQLLTAIDKAGYLSKIKPEKREALRERFKKVKARKWQIPAGL